MADVRNHLHRFWFDFDSPQLGTPAGCGVTAINEGDAKSLLREVVFEGELPAINRVLCDVDVRDLDQGHVVPNMGDPSIRGVWFPLGPARG
jgi:hypothetical protein